MVCKNFTFRGRGKIKKKGFQKKYGICTNCSLGNADFMGSNHSFSKKENINKANLV